MSPASAAALDAEGAINFGAMIGDVARELLGDPSSARGNTLRWGNQGSMKVDLDKGCFHDKEANEGGGTIDLIMRQERCDKRGALTWMQRKGFMPRRDHAVFLKPGQRIVETFEFRKGGKLHYRKHRIEPGLDGKRKEFRYDQPDGAGGWAAGIKGAERVPYRSDDLRDGDALYMTEGERKADRLREWGFCATSFKDWQPQFASYLAGRDVIVLPDNDAPGETQATAIIGDIRKAGGNPLTVRLPGLAQGGDILDWNGDRMQLAKLVETARSQPTPKPGLAFRTGLSARALLAMQFAPINYIVTGYVVEGLTLLAGAPKIGKSWMALNMAVAVAAGSPVFGSIPCDQGDVLYLALEDNPRRLKRRLRHMGIASAPDRLTFCTEWPNLDNGCLDEIGAWIAGVDRPTMIVVDVLAKVRGETGNKDSAYEADYRVLAGLQTIAGQHGLAIVVVHHTRKMEAEDPFDSVSGTRGLTGAADTVLVLKRDIGTARVGQATLYGRGRDIEEIETACQLERDNGTWRIIGAAHEVAKTDERQEILDTLRKSANPLNAREISDLTGKNYDAVRKTLTRMAAKGEVEKSGRGQYVCPNGPNVPNASDMTPDWDIGTHGTGFSDPDDYGPNDWGEGA